MKTWTLIVNPHSASTQTAGVWETSRKFLEESGVSLDVKETQAPAHAITLAHDAAAAGQRQFIAAGGDGTIHEVMTGLLRYADESGTPMEEFTLAVLPYGTGNDWIRMAGVPADMLEAARCIAGGKTAKEDVVRLTLEGGTFCLANIGGVGMDADICIHANNLKKKGHKGGFLYTLVAPYSIITRKRRPARIVCDGETVFEGKLFTLLIGNGSYRGGGLVQTEPGAKWDDGLLEASIMGNIAHLPALFKSLHMPKGDFAAQPGVINRHFKKMTVTPLGKTADSIEADGEIPGKLPLTVEVTGQQINIIVP